MTDASFGSSVGNRPSPEDDLSQFHLLNGYAFRFSTWAAFLRSQVSKGQWE
jgi:hypothetical protein